MSITKSTVKDIVWDLWEGYESDMDEFPMWGSDLDLEDQKVSREKVIEYVVNALPVARDEVVKLLGSIEYMREFVVYGDREVSEEVDDWTDALYGAFGKKESQVGYDLLKTKVDELVSTYDEKWSIDPKDYPRDPERNEAFFKEVVVPMFKQEQEWEKKVTDVLVEMGVPQKECNCLIHYGRISKLMNVHKEVRTEVYENVLRRNSKYVKV